MRILLVNKFFWRKGGSEGVMFDLLEGYEREGHATIHFSMRSSRNEPSPWADHFVSEVNYELLGGVAGLRAATSVVYSREAKAKITRLIREARPDVAHLHNFHHQLSPSIVDALRREGIPAVHTLHDYKVICPNYLLFTKGEPCERCRGARFHHAVIHRCLHGRLAPSLTAFAEMTFHSLRGTLAKGVGLFVSPSRFLAAKLEEFGFPRDRIRVVPNGIDPRRYPVAEAPGEDFLYFGRLSQEKGLGSLLRALSIAKVGKLRVAGAGPEEELVRCEAEGALSGRVELLGFLDRDELLRRIRGARAVVLPSLWYENAPVAALEAMASGVPVIGSKIGGIPEIVRDRETGLLFAPGDSAELASRLELLAGDRDLAFRMGRKARSVVEEEYGLSRQVREMLAILEEMVTSRSR
jgi:glycosyltransferase involved in cell wall biosynthesis